MQARVDSLTEAFSGQGAAWELPPTVAARLFRGLAATERRKPAPSLAAQTAWAKAALRPLLAEFCDAAETRGWAAEEVATAAYALHCAAGHPGRVIPLLNDDVAAYTEMVTSVTSALPRAASSTVPRLWWTRRGTLGGLVFVTAACVLASLQVSSLQVLTWGESVPTGTSKLHVASAALVAAILGVAYA